MANRYHIVPADTILCLSNGEIPVQLQYYKFMKDEGYCQILELDLIKGDKITWL